MTSKDPIKVVENFIKLYGYTHIIINKIDEDLYRIDSINEIPETLNLLIQDKYHILGGGRNYNPFTGDLKLGYHIEFSEFPHISQEIYKL